MTKINKKRPELAHFKKETLKIAKDLSFVKSEDKPVTDFSLCLNSIQIFNKIS